MRVSLTPLWTPSPARVAVSNMTHFQQALENDCGRTFADYFAMHRYSVEEAAAFWRFYLADSGLPVAGNTDTVISGGAMPDTRWFEGTTTNYARAALFPPAAAADDDAVIAVNEQGAERRLSYRELRRQVAVVAAALRANGIGAGDRVAASIGNVPEAVILLLACAAVGAVFSSGSPDFGEAATLARFGQIAPRLFVAASAYDYNGKRYDRTAVVRRLAAALGESCRVVLLPPPDAAIPAADFPGWDDWLAPYQTAADINFTPVEFNHPLYILYSSGTTGTPKAIVHRTGGVMLKHHSEQRLHNDIRPGDRVLYFTTCGWMMWNWLVSALMQGAAIVLFDGSPTHPNIETLWRLAERLQLQFFGVGARFIHGCRAAELAVRDFAPDLALRTIASTGSPLSPSGFEWIYRQVKTDVHVASISGGTDIVGCFIAGNPNLPVYAGQIQVPTVGVDIAVYDDAGVPVIGQAGELVCRTAFPSMPLQFWNDADKQRYRAAYFGDYTGVWRHGDLIEQTAEGGYIVYGRSDATLNPGGVRIGTAELYRPLESIADITDAVAAAKRNDDDEVIWLFVVLADGLVLDDALIKRIETVLRENASPRHVPKRIIQVSQLPQTGSGKTMELAVTKLINGEPLSNREAAANPDALDEIGRAI